MAALANQTRLPLEQGTQHSQILFLPCHPPVREPARSTQGGGECAPERLERQELVAGELFLQLVEQLLPGKGCDQIVCHCADPDNANLFLWIGAQEPGACSRDLGDLFVGPLLRSENLIHGARHA
jgi:hypothetical protein